MKAPCTPAIVPSKGMNRSSFPDDLVLTLVSRRPTRLDPATLRRIQEHPLPLANDSISVGDLYTAAVTTSIVVVTYDNLPFTRLCLESVLANTEYPGYELIVVDNGSTDGTADYLRELASSHPQVQVVYNGANRGFAAANNQGLTLARGDVLVLLNNDTIVPRGWLTGLVRHLSEPAVGLIGPVTNRIGNEAEIEVSYRTYGELEAFAQEYTDDHKGEVFDIRTLCMFCLGMRRDVYERLGPLDERFEVGLLEDDDYSRRAHEAGYRVICAEDVFVHHFGSVSFGHLVPTGEFGKLLEANRRRFEEKWGVAWEPYGRRLSQRYLQLYDRIREVVRDRVPSDAIVLVVSRGDDALLRLDCVRALHFPQDTRGEYAGHYFADSAEAIEHLEALRANGAEFLLFPYTAHWWLDYYGGFRQHLESRYRIVTRQKDTCIVFDMSGVSTRS